jgi:NTE family protein
VARKGRFISYQVPDLASPVLSSRPAAPDAATEEISPELPAGGGDAADWDLMAARAAPATTGTAEDPAIMGLLDDAACAGPRRPGAALCLSGGGYRAMLFHAGAIWRLNELGVLRSLEQISSVSGGSITAGMLGLAWKKLAFDERGVAHNLVDELVEPLRALARLTIDLPAVTLGAFIPKLTAATRIEAAFRSRLYGDATLAQLPADGEGPELAINATNVQTGGLFRFSRSAMRDARIGTNRATQDVPLARAVAASAAFPPLLSPMVIHFEPGDFTRDPTSDLHEEPYTSRVLLTDGGVYDNLALQTAFDCYETLLVSDAGAALRTAGAPGEDWARHGLRTVEIIQSQVTALRKRQLLALFRQDRPGAYWGIRSDLDNYARRCPGLRPLPFVRERALELAGTPTRLAALEERHQEALIDWGYTVCDAAMRGHLHADAPRPSRTPYCTFGDGEVCSLASSGGGRSRAS